jgi:hypothetical protein
MRESWSEPEPPPRRGRPAESSGGGGEALEQGLDRLVSAGRHLVDGVSGARPGSRPSARAAGRGAGGLPRLNELGRWVETKLDWILDEEDSWREPWEESQDGSGRSRSGPGRFPPASPAPSASSLAGADPSPLQAPRRPLEAISRRGASRPSAEPPARQDGEGEDWPDEDSFALPRWQRPLTSRPETAAGPTERQRPAAKAPAAPGRSLPRSSRRRSTE